MPDRNPKLDGSGLIDCIPQTGKCPRGCAECFYNHAFFRPLDAPLIPTPEEAKGRIVRMNSGHDSGLEKEKVIGCAAQYDDAFFNTAGTDRDFPGPVVLTVNPATVGDDFHKIDPIPPNLMFVRFRACLWNLNLAAAVCFYYSEHNVPIVFTWMRYHNLASIPEGFRQDHVLRKSILNDYWALPKTREAEETRRFVRLYARVYHCGTAFSSLCQHCGNCLREYFATKERLNA